MNLKYYNADIHLACFALPNFVGELFEQKRGRCGLCQHIYQDKITLEEYCELLDRPCAETCDSCCPLVAE